MNNNQGEEQGKNLPSAQKNQGINSQTNNLKPGNLIDQSIANLSQEQIQNLMVKASEEALRLEIKAREQGFDYKAGRQALEDHIGTFNSLGKQDFTTRHVISSDIKTGAGRMKVESKTGGVCFVATATYGDANHPDVVSLRLFRDQILVDSWVGRLFIVMYWHIGPKIAKAVGVATPLKALSKWFLGKIVDYIRRSYQLP